MFFEKKLDIIFSSNSDFKKGGVYYTEWSKSEREKQILYINTYKWNLEMD